MKTSPLDREHRSLGARMTEFGGWEMPLQYVSGTIAEHMNCRTSSVAFDVSHLGSVSVSGRASFDRLQSVLCNDLTKIAPGRAQYTHLLDDDGSVADDIIVWWVDDEEFLVMPNASNTERVLEAIGGRDITHERAVIAVQGPLSRDSVIRCWGESAWVPRFAVRSANLAGSMCTIAGTGYTGESGVEIQVPADAAASIWNRLVEAGVSPAGLGARDTLRLEAGLPLHGHELGPGITPLQADLEWVVAWNKPTFTGRDALIAEKARGVHRKLYGLITEGRRPPRSGSEVFSDDRHVGVVTSGNFSPVLGHGIALALLDPSCSIGESVSVRVRESEIDGRIVQRPFVATGRQ